MPGTSIAAEPAETYTWQLRPQYDRNGALEYQY